MREVRLKLLDGPSYWMTHYAEADGSVYLDLDDAFSIQLTRDIEALTNINKINVEALLGTSIVATPKNENLIGKPTRLAVNENEYDDFTVQLMIGMRVFMQSTLRVLERKSGKRGEVFEVEILDTTSHWAVLLNTTYLPDLPWSPVEYNSQEMWDSMNMNAKYLDGDPGFWWPLVNYGRWVKDGEFNIGDFRPWFHALNVVQKAFNKVGWTVACPVLETEIGRRIGTYLLDKDYTKIKSLTDKRGFEAYLLDPSGTQDLKLPNPKRPAVVTKVPFKNETYDYGNNFDPATGVFTGVGYYEFSIRLLGDVYIFDRGWDDRRTSILFVLIHEQADGSQIEVPGTKVEWKDEKLREEIDATIVANVLLKPGESVYLKYRAHGDSISRCSLWNWSWIKAKALEIIPTEGDILDLKSAMRNDKVLDYIKGLAHLFNWKFQTNFYERKVYLLTPYDQDFFGDNVTGYFQDTLQDLTDYIDHSELSVKVPQEDKKNIYLKFKESSDTAIEKLNLDEKSDLHSKFIDKGYDFNEETEIFENPYFEPTYNDKLNKGGVISLAFDVPQCLDNDQGERSYNIGPRIVIFGGMLPQYDPDGKQSPQVIYDFPTRQTVATTPYAWQLANGYTGSTFDPGNNQTTFSKPTSYLVYGEGENDLYTLFYKRYFAEFRDCQAVSLKFFDNIDQVYQWSFRKRTRIIVDGSSQTGRLLAINGYNPETFIGALVFKPDNTNSPVCQDIPELPKCENYPAVLVTATGGGNYTIAASGQNASPVASTVIEWRYADEDPNSWTAGTTFNTTSRKVIARITWTYTDGCVSQTRTQEVEPCANYPRVCAERVAGEPNTLSVYECGTHNDTITGTLFEYSTNNGTTWQQVPDPFLLKDVPEQILLRVTVYYQNCPEKSATGIYANYPTVSDCEFDGLDVPTVMGVSTPAGIILVRRGLFTGTPAMDYIKYRRAGTDEDWDIYDDINQEVLHPDSTTTFEAQRIIIFCNNQCPIYCGPVVTFEHDCPGEIVINATTESCDFELKWENPDDNSNTWKAAVADDRDYVTPTVRAWMEKDCSAVITELYSRTVQWASWNFKTRYSFTWQETHTVQKLTISKNDGGVQTLNQNINIGVTFDPGATNDQLRADLYGAIVAQMNQQFAAVNGVDYDLIVTITGTGTSRTAEVAFLAKKVVNTLWWGPKKGSDYLRTITPGNVTTDHTATGVEFQKVSTAAPIVSFITPCGNELRVRINSNVSNRFFNDASCDFDTLVLNSPIAVEHDVLTTLTDSCDKHDLTLTLTGCSGSPVYTWKVGSKIISTAATATHYGSKPIRAFVSCGDSCTYMAEFVG